MRFLATTGFVLSICIFNLRAIAATAPATQPIGPNLVTNGGFEEDGDWPFVPSGAEATGQTTGETGHNGTHCFKLTNKSPFGPNVYGRAFQTVNGLEPFTTYRISCYVKGRNIGNCWIGGGPGWTLREHFPTGSYNDWKLITTEFTTQADAGDFDLMLCTESPTDACFIDDVKMEPIHADVEKRDAILHAGDAMRQVQFEHLKILQAAIDAEPGAANDPIIHLGVYVARRFLDRVTSKDIHQSVAWSNMQIEEVDSVLNETQHQLELWKSHGGKPRVAPHPTGGPVTIVNGLFHTDTTAGKDQPWYFYGMGHFDQIYKDLPFWHDMGVSMLQDGRCGPNSMNADGSFRASATKLLADFTRASLYNIKIDYLLSPHYFPDWAWTQPGADKSLKQANPGFLYFNIDHPVAKDAIGRWAQNISAALKDKTALFSVCLSNEPLYSQGGRSRFTLPIYQQYLKDIHKDIATLNDLYGTKYTSFDEIKAPPNAMAKDVNGNRAYYDWCRYNQKQFADWHGWLRSIIHKNLPNTPTHAKIMVFLTFDRDKLGWGVDAEAICDATDLAGCDAYAFPDGDYKSYQWHGHEFWYDFLNSFHNQSVFNSENHMIPDGTGPVHIPITLTRAQFWQDALHHQGVTTTWVWEEASDPSLVGDIFFRPANIYGASRAFLDLARFAPEVTAINDAPPQVAILYSQPSVFWEEQYRGNTWNIYTHLNFLGQKVTFVSEKMLREGRVPASVKWIVLGQATHVENTTVDALQKFIAVGGKVLQVGENNLAFDQYDRKRDSIPAELTGSPKFTWAKTDLESEHALHDLLTAGGLQLLEAHDAKSDNFAWNVEYRQVDMTGRSIMPVINFNKDAVAIKFPDLAGKQAIDLLSDETVDLQNLSLPPMTPMLLEVK